MIAGAAGGATVAIAIKAVDMTKAAFSSVGRSSATLTQRLQRIGPAIAGVGAALGGALALTAGAFREYDAHLRRAVQAANMTEEEYKRLRKVSMDLSDAVIGPTALAKGLHALSKISKDAALDMDTVRKYTNLAKAAQMDFTTAVEKTTDVLGLFGMGAEEIGAITDRLTAITQMSSWTMDDLLNVMIKTAPTASAVGMSINEFSAILAAMAARGMATRTAASALKMALAGLSDPASKAREGFEKFGVAVEDANGNLRPANQLLAELADKFAEAEDPTMKTNAAIAIFGRDAGPAMVDILSKGSEGLAEFDEKLGAAVGSTERMAKITEDAVGPIGKLKAWLEKVRISVGEFFAQNEALITGLSMSMMAFGSMARAIPTVVETIKKLNLAQKLHLATLKLHAKASLAAAAAKVKLAIASLFAKGALKGWIFGLAIAGAAVAGLIATLHLMGKKIENIFGGSPMGQFEKSMKESYEVTKRYGGLISEELGRITAPALAVGVRAGGAGGGRGPVIIHGGLHFNFPETPATPEDFSRAVVDKLRTMVYL
jgi:TP901 family phage tail tape measure protein